MSQLKAPKADNRISLMRKAYNKFKFVPRPSLVVDVESESELTIAAESEEPISPYADLIFKPETHVKSPASPIWQTKPALVKRVLPAKPSSFEKPLAPKFGLCFLEDGPLEVYSRESSVCTRLVESFELERPIPGWQRDLKARVGRSQKHCLRTWACLQTYRRQQRQQLSQQVGKRPDTLIMAQHVLPPLQPYKDEGLGRISDFPSPDVYIEPSYRDSAFFSVTGRGRPYADDRLTSSGRRVYKPQLTIVRPALDGNHFVPDSRKVKASLDGMYVLGQGMEGDTAPATGDAGDEGSDTRGQQAPPPQHQNHDDDHHHHHHDTASPHNVATDDSSSSPSRSATNTEEVTEATEGNEGRQGAWRPDKPCLQVAHVVYAWEEPCSDELIEVGLTSRVGQRVQTPLSLRNLGPVVIHYAWQQEARVDHFRTNRYSFPRLVFDRSDGTLLPFETRTLSVQFKADQPGNWCEHWHLVTTPSLGAGHAGDIPVSFWGMAIQQEDGYEEARQRLDREMEQRAGRRMAERQAQDLLKYLPIRSDTLEVEKAAVVWEKCLVQHAEERLFELNNPGMYCRSSVFPFLAAVTYVLEFGEVPEEKALRQKRAKKTLQVQKDDAEPSSRPASVASQSRLSVRGSLSQRVSNVKPGPWVVGKLQVKKSDFHIGQMVRKVLATDDTEQRECMLRSLNEAVSCMGFRPQVPVRSHIKFQVFRTSLASFVDAMVDDDWRIRNNLGLPAAAEMTLVALEVKASLPKKGKACGKAKAEGRATPEKRKASLKPFINKPILKISRGSDIANINQDTTDSLQDTSSGQEWADGMEKHRTKFYARVYERLGALVESLQPIMNEDGFQLDPFLSTKD